MIERGFFPKSSWQVRAAAELLWNVGWMVLAYRMLFYTPEDQQFVYVLVLGSFIVARIVLSIVLLERQEKRK